MILSRGLCTYHLRRLSFIITIAMAAYTGTLCLVSKETWEKWSPLYFLAIPQSHAEIVSWCVDLDKASPFLYHISLIFLPVRNFINMTLIANYAYCLLQAISVYFGRNEKTKVLGFILQVVIVLIKLSYYQVSQSLMDFEIRFDNTHNNSVKSDCNNSDNDETDEEGNNDDQVNSLIEDFGKLEL